MTERKDFESLIDFGKVEHSGFHRWEPSLLLGEETYAHLAYVPKREVTLVVVEGVRKGRGGRQWREWHAGVVEGRLRDDVDAFLTKVSEIAHSKVKLMASSRLQLWLEERVIFGPWDEEAW